MILIAKSASEVFRMRFSADTAYSYERLLRFSDYTCIKKKWMWILMAAATVIVSLSFSLQFFSIGYDPTITWAFCGVVFIDAAYAFMCFVLPRITLKKSPALNANIHFEFYDELYRIEAVLPSGKEQSELSYTAIQKLKYTDSDLYLFISQNQAYIVDRAGFTLGSSDEFIDFLQSKIDTQRFLDKRKSK